MSNGSWEFYLSFHEKPENPPSVWHPKRLHSTYRKLEPVAGRVGHIGRAPPEQVPAHFREHTQPYARGNLEALIRLDFCPFLLPVGKHGLPGGSRGPDWETLQKTALLKTWIMHFVCDVDSVIQWFSIFGNSPKNLVKFSDLFQCEVSGWREAGYYPGSAEEKIFKAFVLPYSQNHLTSPVNFGYPLAGVGPQFECGSCNT